MRLAPQEEIERISHEAYRQHFKDRAKPDRVINLGPALALDEPDTLQWRGAEFPIRLISWHEGVDLQRVAFELERMAKTPPTDLESLDAMDAFADRTLALFHSFLDPVPAENPFTDATPQEVGALLGFFCLSLMKQNEPASKATAPRPRSTTSMH